MSKKVAFVGFGTVQDVDSQRVADILGVEKTQQLGFFDSISDAAQFVVTKVDGKIVAIDGSSVYVSADADDDTISKARRIKSVGVAVNLDWEPFQGTSYSDEAIRAWISDGEWIDAPVINSAPTPTAPADFVVPSYIDETPIEVFAEPIADEQFPTEPYIPEELAPVQFEAPIDIAPLPIVPLENDGYAYNEQAEAPIEFVPPFDTQTDYQQEFAPEPIYVEEPTPYVDYADPAVLDDAQEQFPAPAPMASFLQVPIPEEPSYNEPIYEEPIYDNTTGQQYANEPAYQENQEYVQYEAAVDETQYAAPSYGQESYSDAPVYETPVEYLPPQEEYAAPVEQYAAPQYEAPVVPFENPAAPMQFSPPQEEPQYGTYTPPTPEAPFIQHSPNSAPEPTPYQRERSMFDQVPAGASNDFESRTGGKIVYVTGSHGGAGKTTTAWTLASLVAVAMQKAGNEDISVWLVEADYRNSKLAQRHNIDPNRTSGHLAEMLKWLQDQSGIVDNLPARKAHAIANSTHRLENGLNIIAAPYDTTSRDTSYIQQAVFQAAQYAKMQGGIVFVDADTISNDDIMDSKLAKAADRVVIVSDAGTEHIDDLKRAARILTTPVINGGLGVAMPSITVLLNKTGPEEFKSVEDSGILSPLALGGYLPFIPEWATGWVGSLTNTATFQNAVVLFARFFNGIVPLDELHRWANYQASNTSKKPGGSWVKRIFSSKKVK